MIVLIYALKVILYSAILFGYYHVILRNKAFHQYNRYYLLSATILAALLPLVRIPTELFMHHSSESLVKTLHIIALGSWEDEFIIRAKSTVFDSLLTVRNILLFIYVTGVIFFILPVIKSFVFVQRLSAKYDGKMMDDITFYNTDEAGTPFSFFKAIYWHSEMPLESRNGQYILQHELYHIRQKHSYDLVFMQCIRSLFWFNPFYHLMKNELQAIHEFLADSYASAQADKYLYAELLVSQAILCKKVRISNQFFQNHIKRRINMITKNNTHRYHYFIRAITLPLLFVVFCAFSLEVNKNLNLATTQKLLNDTVPAADLLKINFDEKKSVSMYTNKEVVVFKFENGDSLIVKADDFKAFAERIKKDKPSDQNMIFTKVEKEATFPGGPDAWIAYLNKTFHYPRQAIEKKIEGTVIIQFVVDKEGNVSDVEAVSGPKTGGLREEGMRVILNSGNWLPATQNGLAVKSYKKQPLTFKLE